jgi:hypothetical protein
LSLGRINRKEKECEYGINNRKQKDKVFLVTGRGGS